MKKLLTVLALIFVVSAFGDDLIPFCMLDHKPEITLPNETPKGLAGWTIVYGIVYSPIAFEWYGYGNDPDYAALCTIVYDYEDYYKEQIGDIQDIMAELSTNEYSEAEAKDAADEIAAIVQNIDYRYIEDGYDCYTLIPEDVWDNYVESQQ